MEDRWDVRKVTAHLPGFAGVGLMTLVALRGLCANAPQIGGGTDGRSGTAVTLAWDSSPDPAVSGYRVYEGTASRNYSAVFDPGNTTNVSIGGLRVGNVYYFAATAYDTNGLESDFSAELVYTNGSSSAPVITNLVRTATGNFTVSGIATPGQICVLLAATNLAPPVIWTPIGTNTVNAQASFTMTDLQATNYPRRFYQLWQPAAVLVLPGNIASGR